jgi:hypothetical protein
VVHAAQPRVRPALVFASEYRLGVSRTVAPAGTFLFTIRDIGQDDHDLVVRRADGSQVGASAVLHGGGLGVLRVRLRPGRYRLVCGIADHEARGMAATLVVRPPRR